MRLIWLAIALIFIGCKAYEINYKDEKESPIINGKPNCNRLTSFEPTCINPATNIELKLIAQGSFSMGSSDADGDANDNEKPARLINITQPFYIAFYETTKSEWNAVMKTGERGSEPATGMSWSQIADAGGFVRKLNAEAGEIKIGGAIYEYALPSEAQWEFAARGGLAGAYGWSDAEASGDYAWFVHNSGGKTHVVGAKKPNGFGLFDMGGNAAEWVEDCYFKYDADEWKNTIDPIINNCSGDRVVRGGNYASAVANLRAAARWRYAKTHADDAIGFRLALVPKR